MMKLAPREPGPIQPLQKERQMDKPLPGAGPGQPATTTSATSRDGRSVTLVVPEGGSTPSVGAIVVATPVGGDAVLCQVLEVSRDGAGAGVAAVGAFGTAVVLGTLVGDGLDRRARPAFAASPVSPADVDQLTSLQRSTDATMEVGRWFAGGADAAAALRPGGFNRHTFLCGQSGSGKTYALGVLLERLLLATDLRVAILDPNADFARLGETLEGVAADEAARLGRREVRVLRSDTARGAGGAGEEPLRMRFRSMSRQAQAATLQLDPVRDHEEYNAFIRLTTQMGTNDLAELMALLDSGGDGEQRLARRIENLGLPQWEVWARDLPSAAQIVTSDTGVTVMDLGGFGDPLEPISVALEVIEELWSQRDRRVPTLIVIDEAHNLCRADPSSPVARLLLDRIIQIAAEGRKYGLWLLLSSQRPSKIHPQVLSQCDNLMLMRMNSPDDVTELGRAFGFAPPSMLRAATGFVQGEALLAGGFAPVPMLVRMRSRLTREGGSDVPVPLAADG